MLNRMTINTGIHIDTDPGGREISRLQQTASLFTKSS